MLFNNGIGVAQDNRRAFALFQAAAEAGDPLAAYKVGCYHAGQFPGVVPQDEEQALRYKLVAAEAGYSLAQVDVANIYMRRRIMPERSAGTRRRRARGMRRRSTISRSSTRTGWASRPRRRAPMPISGSPTCSAADRSAPERSRASTRSRRE